MGNARQNERRKLYRTSAQIYFGLDKQMANVLELKEIFTPVHPEYNPLFDAVLQMLLMSQQTFVEFTMLAWQKDGKDLEVYRED